MQIRGIAFASVLFFSFVSEAQQIPQTELSLPPGDPKSYLETQWIGDENHRMIGVDVKRAILVEDGKYVLVEAVMARNSLKMKVNDGALNLVKLPPIKENIPRTFYVKLAHKARVERLDFEFENVLNADKYYLSLQIIDENFVPPPGSTVALAPVVLELPMPSPTGRGGSDPDSIHRTAILNSKSAWSVDFGYGSSIIKGTDVQTQKTATLASGGDMRIAIEWQTTLNKKVRTHFMYSFQTIKRLAPVGWGLTSAAGVLDRPQIFADFSIWRNLTVFPGFSFGEFEWLKVSNAQIDLKKTRQISVDFGFKFLPITWISFQWGPIVQGQSLVFSEGGSNLDMGLQIQGTAGWSQLAISLLNTKSSLLMENTKSAMSQSSIQLKYLF